MFPEFHHLFVRSIAVVSACLALTACGSADEINFFAGDSELSFAQNEQGAYVRTDAGVLGDLSDTLPEGVVPVSSVKSAQGTVPTEVASADGESSGGGGFNFGNITFRTAKSAERAAAREASGKPEPSADPRALPAPIDDSERPGLLMRMLGMGGDTSAAMTGAAPALGPDGLPLVSFNTPAAGSVKVNRHLWNATAQILSFMPLSVADQRRGLYVTDWHMDNELRPERVRVDVQHNNDIIGPGSFHVTVYRQVIEEGMWRNAPSSLPAARELERRILLAAQELKIAAG